MNANWYEQELTTEFTTVIAHTFPQVGELLDHCYVKLIQSFWGRPLVHFLPYIAVYSPDSMITALQTQISVLREVAEYVGLAEVVCLNATHLLRDPMTKLKHEDPRLWLDLHLIATQSQEHLL